MKILALETSHAPGMLALLNDEQAVFAKALPAHQRTTQSFAVEIQRAFKEVDWQPAEVELFAVSRGPGSFTGLRIGITAAKVFSYATGCQITSVDTMRVIAAQVDREYKSFWVTLDAQRQQLYTRNFKRIENELKPTDPIAVVDALPWINRDSGDLPLTGTGLSRWLDQISHPERVLPESLWTPTAITLGRLALDRFRSGHTDDRWTLAPTYHRRSAAEEKADL